MEPQGLLLLLRVSGKIEVVQVRSVMTQLEDLLGH